MKSLFRWLSRHWVLALVAAVGLVGGATVRGRRSGGDRPAQPRQVASVPRPSAVSRPEPVSQSAAVPQPAGTTETDTPPLAIPIADALAVTPGPHPGSALARKDGSAPTPDFTIKGKTGSMRCHGPESPYFHRTKADVWFRTESDAEAAGFRPWRPNDR